MLWTLLKILIFAALVLGLAIGAEALINSTDHILLVVFGREYTISPLIAVLGLGLLLLAMWLVLKLAGFMVALLRFINGDETALSRYFDRSRERRGFKALTEGLLALASGEHAKAMEKAKKAESLLQRPEITTLLSAQAAEASGNAKAATAAYKKLLGDAQTRFVGIRGLMKQKLAAGETDVALKLAEKAYALKPKHAETQDTLLGLQTQEENWLGARSTLTSKLKAGHLPRDVHRRRYAVLSIAQAREALALGQTDEARAEAFEANRLSPDLVPGAVLAARIHTEAKAPRKATSVLKTAWKANPHPDLAAAFADIVPDEAPKDRLKRFQPLLKLLPDHPETKLLRTELFLAAEDYDGARTALGDLAETTPTARSLTLMAAIERGTGAEDHVVRAYLTRATQAPRGPAWVCSNCGTVHGSWAPICENCTAFDTLDWVAPMLSERGDLNASTPLPSHMLPLLAAPVETQDTVETSEEPAAQEDVLSEAPPEPDPEPAASESEQARAENTTEIRQN